MTFDQLLNETPVILDGAWGTQMQARGLPVGGCPDLWNEERPDDVRAVAAAYVDAGSQIVLTNTFGSNRYLLERHGASDRVKDLNRRGAELSREAAGDQALVFGSIGPTGKMVMMGDVDEDELLDAFSEQASALVEGGAQGLVLETMADPEELACGLKAAVATGVPVVACMVFDSGPELDRTMMGATPEQLVETAESGGAAAVGSNCGRGIEAFVPLCRRLKEASSLPVWIKANAGLPEMKDGQTVYTMTPDVFASHVPALREAGASLIGGCCGTSPDFIRALAAL